MSLGRKKGKSRGKKREGLSLSRVERGIREAIYISVETEKDDGEERRAVFEEGKKGEGETAYLSVPHEKLWRLHLGNRAHKRPCFLAHFSARQDVIDNCSLYLRFRMGGGHSSHCADVTLAVVAGDGSGVS